MVAKQPVGQRGDWFADLEGISYPCVHDTWWTGKDRYVDPYAVPGDPKWDRFASAIEEKRRVILTKDAADGSRAGYIALFEIDDVVYRHGELSFKFVKRLDELD